MKHFPADFYAHLDSHTLVGIKGGSHRDRFLKIWMVYIGERVFARSWGKSERSWFTAFIEEGKGQIEYGEKIINVTGKPCDDVKVNKEIDAAYKRKYTSKGNLPYVKGITQPEYIHFTMEFFFTSDAS